MKHVFTRRSAPIWLPALIFVRDFIAWQYIFSFEPGITAEAVYRGKLFMLPGSLISGGLAPMVVNLAIALVVGLLLRWFARGPARQTG
jgi:hypothetical protein